MENLVFHAVCSEGLLELLKNEVNSHSLRIQSENRGGLFFQSRNWGNIASFLISTRISSKVGIVFAHWKVEDYDSLYEKALPYAWEELLPLGKSFRIMAKTKDNLPDSRFSMYKLKDAILDRFRKKNIPIPDIQKDKSDITIFLRSYMDHAALELMLTPDSLAKRGYRNQAGTATLRENIASAMIEFSGWDRKSVLIDPFCGQGTILIEAGRILQETSSISNIPRNSALSPTPLHKSYVYQRLASLHSASDLASSDQSASLSSPSSLHLSPPSGPVRETSANCTLMGIDESQESLEMAKNDIESAGLTGKIELVRGRLENLKNILKDRNVSETEKLTIITDPPWGKRLGSQQESQEIFAELGKVLKSLNREIEFTLITGDTSLLGYLKLKKEKELSIKNSNIPSKIVHYKIYPRENMP